MAKQSNPNEPKKQYHIVARIVCLLLAVVIWFVVAGVKVTLVGEDALVNYEISSYERTITVTIKGDHSKVIEVSPEDITVTVDVSAINSSGVVRVPANVQFSPKLEGITAYGEYTVEIRVSTVRHNNVGS